MFCFNSFSSSIACGKVSTGLAWELNGRGVGVCMCLPGSRISNHYRTCTIAIPAHVRKRVHAGLPMDVYLPVKVNRPVFRSTRKDAMLSLRWLHAYRKDPPGSICMCLG